MVQRTAGWNSRAKVKGRLQAALYSVRKKNMESRQKVPPPNPPDGKEAGK